MNQRLSLESEHAARASDTVPIRSGESELANRLREAVAGDSQAGFARRSEISESLLRQYLAGTMPSADRLVRMADAANVSIEWLATGRGPKTRSPPAPAGFDLERLTRTIAAVQEGLAATRRTLPPAKYAQLVAAAYELMAAPDASSSARVIQFIKAAA